MRYNKEKYETMIDESPLFSLDREKQRSAYSREAMKMVESLYCYLMAVNKRDYEPYGMEIVDTAKRCIKNYDPGSGRFLNYFYSSWKQNYRHLIGRTLTAGTFSGIHFTKEEERNLRKYMRLAQVKGINPESPEFERKMIEVMGLTSQEWSALRDMINSKPVPGICFNSEGEEYSLIDQLDSGSYTDSSILQLEKAGEFLDLIELIYGRLQERQKPLLASMITAKLSMMIIDYPELEDVFKEKIYFQEAVYKECIQCGRVIQVKAIAERFGLSEASVSRTWKNFIQKLKLAVKNQ